MKKFLAIALAATAMVWAADPFTDGGNLVDGTTQWGISVDTYGTSTAGTVESLNPVIASFTLGASNLDVTPQEWVWGEVTPGFTADFSALKSIEIKGTFSKPTRLTLVGTAAAGGASGAYIKLISGTVDETIEVNATNFTPSWGTAPSLDLTTMTGISFTSGIDEECTYEMNIEKLILHAGTGGGDEPCDDWNEWEVTTDATCDAPGVETRTSNCDGVEPQTRPIPQLTGPECEASGDWPGYMEIIGDEYVEWSIEGLLDSYGETDVVVNGTDPLNATLTLGNENESENIWPYLGLATYLETGIFTSLTKVDIEYTASGNLTIGVAVAVEPFEEDDELIEEVIYVATLSSSSNSGSFVLSDFVKPEWPTKYNGPANLSLVDASKIASSITFSHENYGETVELEVTSLKAYIDEPTETSIKQPFSGMKSAKASTMAITGISAGKLGLNVVHSGNYSISLYSVDGRMLSQTKANLVKGINTLSIGKNLAKGIMIVRIKGMNTQLIKKIMVK